MVRLVGYELLASSVRFIGLVSLSVRDRLWGVGVCGAASICFVTGDRLQSSDRFCGDIDAGLTQSAAAGRGLRGRPMGLSLQAIYTSRAADDRDRRPPCHRAALPSASNRACTRSFSALGKAERRRRRGAGSRGVLPRARRSPHGAPQENDRGCRPPARGDRRIGPATGGSLLVRQDRAAGDLCASRDPLRTSWSVRAAGGALSGWIGIAGHGAPVAIGYLPPL